MQLYSKLSDAECQTLDDITVGGLVWRDEGWYHARINPETRRWLYFKADPSELPTAALIPALTEQGKADPDSSVNDYLAWLNHGIY